MSKSSIGGPSRASTGRTLAWILPETQCLMTSPRVMMRTPHRTPGQFNDSLQCSFCRIAHSVSQAAHTFFFVAAWNEWAEQCVLEPDTINKFGFLDALKFNIDNYPRWSETSGSCPV